MARYFFDSIVAGSLVEDEEGKELAELTAVRHYARDALGDIARHAIARGAASIIVLARDETGMVVYRGTVSVNEEADSRDV